MTLHPARTNAILAGLLSLAALLPGHAALAETTPAHAVRMQLSVSAFVVESCTISSVAHTAQASASCAYKTPFSIQTQTATAVASDATTPTEDAGNGMVVVTF